MIEQKSIDWDAFDKRSKIIKAKDRKGVVLLSGGLDSCVVAAMLKRYEWEFDALCVDYGQRHYAELAASKAIAGYFDAYWHTVSVGPIASSAMTDRELACRTLEEIREDTKNSPAYMPGRNGIFLSLALAYAEDRGLSHVFIGATAEDHAGFPDCRLEYYEKWSELGTQVLGRPFRVVAPLAQVEKAEVVRLGVKFDAPMGLTISCYQPIRADLSCGRCDACLIRRDAFEQAGMKDPVDYAVEL